MANTFLTAHEIAMESIARLNNNLVFANLVHRDFEKEFQNKGDKVQIRKPATLVAKDFSNETEVQDITENNVDVKLDKIADVTVEVSSKQLTLNIQDFGTQVVEPAMTAIAQKIDSDLAGLYADIPYAYGTAGTTPATLADIANVGKVLNSNKAPLSGRNLVIDPEAQAKLVVLDAIAGADKSGSTDAFRESNLGRVLGFNTFMNQNIKTHTKGTMDKTVGNLDVTAAKGATSITVEDDGVSGAVTGTLKKGDIITIEDTAGQYVCTADGVLNTETGKMTVAIYPALEEACTGKKVTVTGSHIANLGFHRNAFSLVCRPQELPLGGANGYIVNYNGLYIRVVMGYTMAKKINEISFDILYGVKTLTPELACRLLG